MPRLDPSTLGQHVDPMYRAAWALCGSREDAEDLVQETFARVLSRPRTVRGEVRPYLMQALRNTFHSRLRTQARRPRTAELPPDAEPPDPRARSPHAAAEAAEIMRAVAELPEDFRLAVVAVDILGLSYAEAAAALDTREATITTRVYRGRTRVAERLTADGREGSATARSLSR